MGTCAESGHLSSAVGWDCPDSGVVLGGIHYCGSVWGIGGGGLRGSEINGPTWRGELDRKSKRRETAEIVGDSTEYANVIYC